MICFGLYWMIHNHTVGVFSFSMVWIQCVDVAAWGRDMSQWTAIYHSVSLCRIFHQYRQSTCFTSGRWSAVDTWLWVTRTFWLVWPSCWRCKRGTVVCYWHKWYSYKDCTSHKKYDMLLLLYAYHVYLLLLSVLCTLYIIIVSWFCSHWGTCHNLV